MAWEDGFKPFSPSFRIYCAEKFCDFGRLAESLHLSILSFSSHFNTIVYNAGDYACSAVDAQVVNDADFAVTPVECFRRAYFYAEFTFKALARPFIDGDVSFIEKLLDLHCFEELTSFNLPAFLIRFLKEFKYSVWRSLILTH